MTNELYATQNNAMKKDIKDDSAMETSSRFEMETSPIEFDTLKLLTRILKSHKQSADTTSISTSHFNDVSTSTARKDPVSKKHHESTDKDTGLVQQLNDILANIEDETSMSFSTEYYNGKLKENKETEIQNADDDVRIIKEKTNQSVATEPPRKHKIYKDAEMNTSASNLNPATKLKNHTSRILDSTLKPKRRPSHSTRILATTLKPVRDNKKPTRTVLPNHSKPLSSDTTSPEWTSSHSVSHSHCSCHAFNSFLVTRMPHMNSGTAPDVSNIEDVASRIVLGQDAAVNMSKSDTSINQSKNVADASLNQSKSDVNDVCRNLKKESKNSGRKVKMDESMLFEDDTSMIKSLAEVCEEIQIGYGIYHFM